MPRNPSVVQPFVDIKSGVITDSWLQYLIGLGQIADVGGVVSIPHGGSGATTPAGARTAFGLGPLATQSTIDLLTQATGILPIVNGGNGTATPNLVAGTNITISGAWPNQTINSSNSGGSVTSVGLALPSIFSVSGTPVTGSGTLTGTLATQSANTLLAGPTSGGAAAPTFRTISSADLSDGNVGTGAIAHAADPSFTGTAMFQNISVSTLGATTATLITAHTTTFDATTATIATAIIGTGTITNLTVDVPAGGTSTGTIGTFKDIDGVNTRLLVDSVGAVPVIDFRQARGTSAAPSASQTDDILGILAARGYGATGYNLTTASGAISFRAAENWTNTAQGSYFTFETTPNGSTTRAIQARVNNDGKFGIGRTATTYLLEVAGDIFSTGAFRGSGANLTGITSGQVSGLAAVATSGSASDLGSGTLPAARLPNPSATTLGGVQSKAAVASNWLTSISTSGVPAASQPAFTDISGTAATTQGGTGNTGGAWTTFTPTVVASTPGATPPTYTTLTGHYEQIGKKVWGWVRIVVNANGTGAGFLKLTLPVTMLAAGVGSGTGYNNGTNQVLTVGLFGSANQAFIFSSAGAYPVTSGSDIWISFTYEAA